LLSDWVVRWFIVAVSAVFCAIVYQGQFNGFSISAIEAGVFDIFFIWFVLTVCTIFFAIIGE
jgi:hypothetical protein